MKKLMICCAAVLFGLAANIGSVDARTKIKTIKFSGLHYPKIQKCRVAKKKFRQSYKTSYHLTSKCKKATGSKKVRALRRLKCVKGTKANRFNTGTVISGLALCGGKISAGSGKCYVKVNGKIVKKTKALNRKQCTRLTRFKSKVCKLFAKHLRRGKNTVALYFKKTGVTKKICQGKGSGGDTGQDGCPNYRPSCKRNEFWAAAKTNNGCARRTLARKYYVWSCASYQGDAGDKYCARVRKWNAGCLNMNKCAKCIVLRKQNAPPEKGDSAYTGSGGKVTCATVKVKRGCKCKDTMAGPKVTCRLRPVKPTLIGYKIKCANVKLMRGCKCKDTRKGPKVHCKKKAVGLKRFFVKLKNLHYPRINNCGKAKRDYRGKYKRDRRLIKLCTAKKAGTKPVRLRKMGCRLAKHVRGFSTGSVINVVAVCQ